MPRFFTENIDENNIILTGSDAVHIGKSLRMKTGEEITVCSCGVDYRCKIDSITPETVRLTLIEKKPCTNEPNIKFTLFQALPKSGKFEQIIQKSVELGVHRIVPILTRRCVSRPNFGEFQKKLDRYNKISHQASMQSGRGIIPEVAPLVDWQTAVGMMAGLDLSLILYEEQGGKSLRDINFSDVKQVGIAIGSEGGFDSGEVSLAVENSAERIWLGNRILRCETAPVAVLSILMFLTENF